MGMEGLLRPFPAQCGEKRLYQTKPIENSVKVCQEWTCATMAISKRTRFQPDCVESNRGAPVIGNWKSAIPSVCWRPFYKCQYVTLRKKCTCKTNPFDSHDSQTKARTPLPFLSLVAAASAPSALPRRRASFELLHALPEVQEQLDFLVGHVDVSPHHHRAGHVQRSKRIAG